MLGVFLVIGAGVLFGYLVFKDAKEVKSVGQKALAEVKSEETKVVSEIEKKV